MPEYFVGAISVKTISLSVLLCSMDLAILFALALTPGAGLPQQFLLTTVELSRLVTGFHGRFPQEFPRLETALMFGCLQFMPRGGQGYTLLVNFPNFAALLLQEMNCLNIGRTQDGHLGQSEHIPISDAVHGEGVGEGELITQVYQNWDEDIGVIGAIIAGNLQVDVQEDGGGGGFRFVGIYLPFVEYPHLNTVALFLLDHARPSLLLEVEYVALDRPQVRDGALAERVDADSVQIYREGAGVEEGGDTVIEQLDRELWVKEDALPMAVRLPQISFKHRVNTIHKIIPICPSTQINVSSQYQYSLFTGDSMFHNVSYRFSVLSRVSILQSSNESFSIGRLASRIFFTFLFGSSVSDCIGSAKMPSQHFKKGFWSVGSYSQAIYLIVLLLVRVVSLEVLLLDMVRRRKDLAALRGGALAAFLTDWRGFRLTEFMIYFYWLPIKYTHKTLLEQNLHCLREAPHNPQQYCLQNLLMQTHLIKTVTQHKQKIKLKPLEVQHQDKIIGKIETMDFMSERIKN